MDLSPLYLSLKIAFTATLVTFFIGIFAAYRVSKMKRFKNIIDGLLTLPLVLPPTVVGFFLLLIFGKNGLLGQALLDLGMSVVFTWQGAVIAAAVIAFPLMYRTALGAFEQMDINLVYAGRTLGMSEFTIFRRIILPSCWPGVAAGTVLAFARAMGEYCATTMLAGNIPGKTQTMALAVYSAVAVGDRERAFAWVAVIMTLSFISILLMNYFSGYQSRKRQKGGVS